MVFSAQVLDRLRKSRIVAGFALDNANHAVPLARALLDGGIDAIELMLRTPAGIESVKAICASVPEMLVGVGTILTPKAIKDVKAAGAAFGVSPGMNPRVVQAAQDAGLSFAPGIATPSDLEAAIELGCRFVKFFPAEAMGGIEYLRSMSAPYQHLAIEYFPLGGVHANNMSDYLRESNVPVVGGSWIVNKELVQNEAWEAITARADEVVAALQGTVTT